MAKVPVMTDEELRAEFARAVNLTKEARAIARRLAALPDPPGYVEAMESCGPQTLRFHVLASARTFDEGSFSDLDRDLARADRLAADEAADLAPRVVEAEARGEA